MSERPAPDTVDRSKWRYEDGGPAFEAADQFVNLLKVLTVERLQGMDISSRIGELRGRVTQESWPSWRDVATAGFDIPWLNELRGCLPKVRFPADGIAYVFCPIVHPDQTEPVTLGHQQIYMHVVTLVGDRGVWRVVGVGPMIPPQDLGRRPYSW
jgi:hypothetical protein